jgi:hypothetical protein
MPPLSRETDRYAKKSNVGNNIIIAFVLTKLKMTIKKQIWSDQFYSRCSLLDISSVIRVFGGNEGASLLVWTARLTAGSVHSIAGKLAPIAVRGSVMFAHLLLIRMTMWLCHQASSNLGPSYADFHIGW